MNKNEQDMIRKIKEKYRTGSGAETTLEPRQIEAKTCRKEEKVVDSGENQWAGSSMPGADRRSDGIPELF